MVKSKTEFDELELLARAQANRNLQCVIVDHPLVRQALSVMRDEETDMTTFRGAVHSLTPLLVYEASQDLTESSVQLATPISPIVGRHIDEKIVLIPVLRSGVGMLEPAQRIFPRAQTIFAGMARDETTAIAHWYYDLKKLEGLDSGKDAVFFILDPMLATGGSAVETVKRIKEIYPLARIKMIAMISAPEGIQVLNKTFPNVKITTAAVDDHLNSQKYIVPGLGDAGDRQFGTS